jgi:hypothetical protein
VLPDRQHITYIILEYKIIYYAIKNHIYIRRHGFCTYSKGFYILLLNTTLSEKIALPAIKATIAIIGRLIVASNPCRHSDQYRQAKGKQYNHESIPPDKPHIKQSPCSRCRHEHRAGSLSGKKDTG